MVSEPVRIGWTEHLRRAFQYSSGRVIALSRVVLATVFFLALWIDPSQPVRDAGTGYVLVTSYLVLAAMLLLLSWRSWWWDHRLAWPQMVVDVVAFLSAIFFTEGVASDFTSPFLAFFAFLMLAATIRWDWRMTVITGLAVTSLYLLVGLYIGSLEPGFDIYRFGRRISYMLVLSLVLAWFGLQRREQSIEHFVEVPEDPGDERKLLDQALAYAVAQSHAQRAAIAWADFEEPDTRIHTVGLSVPRQSLGPEAFNPDRGFIRSACLFDRRRGRSLVARRGSRPVAVVRPVEDRLAEECGIAEGVGLPLSGLTGRGELLLCDIDGLSADHVGLGVLLAREITGAFDRQATLTLAKETALARVRDSLARDLHDSVAQSLAGTSLRLEGLRAWIRGGGDPEAEINSIKESLREEQRHVRSLIARLRLGEGGDEMVEAGAAIRPLLNALSVQWSVAARLVAPDFAIAIPGWLVHEIGQVLREAVANAVRHGKAGRVDLTIEDWDTELRMTITDDGTGFPGGEAGSGPWSIGERVDKLGGRLAVSTGVQGTTLEISVPMERAA
jgi:signal transduction histidine kinase